ncbi:GNAT superfamily N-acetyltransferase [Agrobacterium larrymoorei]|uniref:GNAT superfamily N-acetyltransferase n=1 Tax=Agrobacterium larrymoorei TaxID=160699 RepID=A0AAJ2B711_9HYPH|nr:GNAT family N-acetyltransferase [Agrobacterium larrymoorei]MDR6100484.1 GNAT superfamily N-acetyltransferase [Agrobacterium larrymoorei]
MIRTNHSHEEKTLIRLLAYGELDVYRQLRLEALALEPAAFASTFEDCVALGETMLQRRLETPVFAAFAHDDPVGMMGLLTRKERKMAHRASIVGVYMRESWRRSGLATKLLNAVIEHAADAGIFQLELGLSAENLIALQFYRRNGFVEAARLCGGYREQGREIDEIIMIRRLDVKSKV